MIAYTKVISVFYTNNMQLTNAWFNETFSFKFHQILNKDYYFVVILGTTQRANLLENFIFRINSIIVLPAGGSPGKKSGNSLLGQILCTAAIDSKNTKIDRGSRDTSSKVTCQVWNELGFYLFQLEGIPIDDQIFGHQRGIVNGENTITNRGQKTLSISVNARYYLNYAKC